MKRVATVVVLALVSVAFLGGCAKKCAEPVCEQKYEKVKKEYGCK